MHLECTYDRTGGIADKADRPPTNRCSPATGHDTAHYGACQSAWRPERCTIDHGEGKFGQGHPSCLPIALLLCGTSILSTSSWLTELGRLRPYSTPRHLTAERLCGVSAPDTNRRTVESPCRAFLGRHAAWSRHAPCAILLSLMLHSDTDREIHHCFTLQPAIIR